eukprot:360322-Chlamydomonas_euryale.AAC.8
MQAEWDYWSLLASEYPHFPGVAPRPYSFAAWRRVGSSVDLVVLCRPRSVVCSVDQAQRCGTISVAAWAAASYNGTGGVMTWCCGDASQRPYGLKVAV